MTTKTKLIILWLVTQIGMILHFNYHIGEIFYGIDVVRPDADGKVPLGTFIIRTIYYHLPVIWILVIMYTDKKIIRLLLLITSVLYLLSHLFHWIGELMNPERGPSQLSLLGVVLLVAAFLAWEHFKYFKNFGEPETNP